MDKKTTGIVVTIVSVVLCGCPGLFICLFGGISALGAGTYELGDELGGIPSGVGFAILCVGILFTLIPVVVGFFMLRNKTDSTDIADESETDETIPPAI